MGLDGFWIFWFWDVMLTDLSLFFNLLFKVLPVDNFLDIIVTRDYLEDLQQWR